jgi:hypothetical protein
LYSEDEYKQYIALTQLNYKHVKEIEDPMFDIDGNAFLIRMNTFNNIQHDVLHLSPIRIAHMLKFDFLNYKVKINLYYTNRYLLLIVISIII